MQIATQSYIVERMLYYWSRLYEQQLKKSENYNHLEKTIEILIADFNILHLENLPYHTKWKIIEEKDRKVILTDKLEFHIIELSKIKEITEDSKLLDWLHFIENPKSERVIMKMKENEELKEAGEKLQNLSEDEILESIVEAELRQRRDKNAIYDAGIEQGIKQNQQQVVKKLIEEKASIDFIIKVTGLTNKEIEQIAQSKN